MSALPPCSQRGGQGGRYRESVQSRNVRVTRLRRTPKARADWPLLRRSLQLRRGVDLQTPRPGQTFLSYKCRVATALL